MGRRCNVAHGHRTLATHDGRGPVGTHVRWMQPIRQWRGHCCIAALESTISASRVVGLGATPCSAAVLIQIAVPVSCLRDVGTGCVTRIRTSAAHIMRSPNQLEHRALNSGMPHEAWSTVGIDRAVESTRGMVPRSCRSPRARRSGMPSASPRAPAPRRAHAPRISPAVTRRRQG